MGPSGTDVTIDVNMSGSSGYSGLSKQHLGKPGDLTWPFSLSSENAGATLVLRRLDNGACSRISFAGGGAVEVNLQGTWRGTYSWTSRDGRVFADPNRGFPLTESEKRPREAFAYLRSETPAEGVLRLEMSGIAHIDEDTRYTVKDGRISAAVIVPPTLLPGEVLGGVYSRKREFRLEGPVELAGKDYVWQGNCSLRDSDEYGWDEVKCTFRFTRTEVR